MFHVKHCVFCKVFQRVYFHNLTIKIAEKLDMPLSWNEIKTRATVFSKEWQAESREDAEAKSFWDAFFNVFGITRRRIASFEEPVKNRTTKAALSIYSGAANCWLSINRAEKVLIKPLPKPKNISPD